MNEMVDAHGYIPKGGLHISHDSFICVTRPLHTCDVPYTHHNSFRMDVLYNAFTYEN